jgi:hypothetical protein
MATNAKIGLGVSSGLTGTLTTSSMNSVTVTP